MHEAEAALKKIGAISNTMSSGGKHRQRLREQLRQADEWRGPTRNLNPRFDGIRLEELITTMRTTQSVSIVMAGYALMIAIPALVLAILNYQSRHSRQDE